MQQFGVDAIYKTRNQLNREACRALVACEWKADIITTYLEWHD